MGGSTLSHAQSGSQGNERPRPTIIARLTYYTRIPKYLHLVCVPVATHLWVLSRRWQPVRVKERYGAEEGMPRELATM